MTELLFLGSIGMPELILIALVVLLFFGGKRIPELMKGLGKGVKGFKEGMNGIEEELNKPENIHLIEISESCHYIGIGTITNEATINFYKYLKYFKDNELFEIDNFIDNFLNHNKKLSFKEILYEYNKVGINNSQKFLEYIKFLQKIYNSGIKSSTGGIIIHKDENGRLSMLPTDNIENLIKNIDKTIHTLQNKIQEKLFKQKNRGQYKERS